MSAADEGRTEDATDKQRNKFRDEGNVPRSMEINTFVQFLMGYLIVLAFGGYLMQGLGQMMSQGLRQFHQIDLTTELESVAKLYFDQTIIILLPVFLILFFSVFIVNIAQFGFKISWKAIKPKFAKLNAFANIKRVLFSVNSVVELLKSVAKLTVLSFLVYLAVVSSIPEFFSLYELTSFQTGLYLLEIIKDIWLYMLMFMLSLGLIDAFYQRYKHNEQMKMTKQQVEDERKQSYGDPKVKKEQRQRSFTLLQKLMMENTAQADVVITNPTHFAIALAYKHGEMAAPKVVAKGVDHMALKIRKKARENGVPIVENRALARGLYKVVTLGESIPESFFKPVAEVLAFIYKLKRERAAS